MGMMWEIEIADYFKVQSQNYIGQTKEINRNPPSG
jgi:hypothetical protein